MRLIPSPCSRSGAGQILLWPVTPGGPRTKASGRQARAAQQRLADRTDSELAVLVSRGEEEAFPLLMRRHSTRVRALLRRMGASPTLADDLLQDAFLAAWQAIGSFRGDASFGAWVCRIAARLYVRRWKLDSRHVLTAQAPEDPQGQGSHESASNARLDLDEAMASLSPAERLCVSLCHGAGMSHSEAAEALRTPLGTVKSHVKRGLDKLRAHLAHEGGGRVTAG